MGRIYFNELLRFFNRGVNLWSTTSTILCIVFANYKKFRFFAGV